MKKQIAKMIVWGLTALPLGVVGGSLLASCNDIVDYKDGYTPAHLLANTGAPLITAVYDVADTAHTTPLTEGTLSQMVVIVGDNLNQAESISFNTVPCDMAEVYTEKTRAILRIPPKLSMEHANKIEYTTKQGTTSFPFLIPFPPLTVSRLQNEFAKAGETVTVIGQNFDLYFTDGGSASVAIVSPSGDMSEASVSAATATGLQLHVPAGTPDDSQLLFSWQTADSQTMTARLPFRPASALLYDDFSGVQISIDGSVQVATETIDGNAGLHFTGSYDAWAWNTIDLSCNMIANSWADGLATDQLALKFELLTARNFPVTDDTGLQFSFNWGDTYAWSPADGLGINTLGQWQTVCLPLAPMATNGISAPGSWQTLRIVFQPHAACTADFVLANLRIVSAT